MPQWGPSFYVDFSYLLQTTQKTTHRCLALVNLQFSPLTPLYPIHPVRQFIRKVIPNNNTQYPSEYQNYWCYFFNVYFSPWLWAQKWHFLKLFVVHLLYLIRDNDNLLDIYCYVMEYVMKYAHVAQCWWMGQKFLMNKLVNYVLEVSWMCMPVLRVGGRGHWFQLQNLLMWLKNIWMASGSAKQPSNIA